MFNSNNNSSSSNIIHSNNNNNNLNNLSKVTKIPNNNINTANSNTILNNRIHKHSQLQVVKTPEALIMMIEKPKLLK